MIFNYTLRNYLKKYKYLNDKDLSKYLSEAESENVTLYSKLISKKVFKESRMYEILALFLKCEFTSVEINELDISLVDSFNVESLIEDNFIPYYKDETSLNIICSNPLKFEELKNKKELLDKYGLNIKIILITESNISKLFDYLSNRSLQTVAMVDTFEEPIIQTEDDGDVEGPVIKLCDSIIRVAVDLGASDIHIEPYSDKVRVRLRVDGVLKESSNIQLRLFPAVLARFKIMAGMNIAEQRIPQDGKITLKVNNFRYDFRVSSLPTIFGEKLVIRIYNTEFNSTGFNELGFSDSQKELMLKIISRPHGIILLTGPTGSGKSTTLYTFLRYLNSENRNIITVEDPVENQIYGINQVQVNNKATLTFSSALRSILRQDPNVIMIGEIRDEETAQIAIRAAITGHLVLSTIHTNDAVTVVTRLINMGIPRYLVSDALVASISQRLIRKLCDRCKKEVEVTEAQALHLGVSKSTKIFVPCGCRYCGNKGYKGRVGLFEVLLNTPKFNEAIIKEETTASELERIALSEGMISLNEEARKKVIKGETSYEEYERLNKYMFD